MASPVDFRGSGGNRIHLSRLAKPARLLGSCEPIYFSSAVGTRTRISDLKGRWTEPVIRQRRKILVDPMRIELTTLVLQGPVASLDHASPYLAGPVGIEPTTLGSSGQRSTYWATVPIMFRAFPQNRTELLRASTGSNHQVWIERHILVDRKGLEPLTSCVQSRRSTKLRLTAHFSWIHMGFEPMTSSLQS